MQMSYAASIIVPDIINLKTCYFVKSPCIFVVLIEKINYFKTTLGFHVDNVGLRGINLVISIK